MTLSDYWRIFNLGKIAGTFAVGIPLAGSSRTLWTLGKPSAHVPQRSLQERRPLPAVGHRYGSNHLRTKDAGTGINASRTLHFPLSPRSVRYDVADERGKKGLLKAMSITG